MKLSVSKNLIGLCVVGLGATAFSAASRAAPDAEAAAALAKKSGCLMCHAVDKDKAASSFQKIAAKWKGNADAQTKLVEIVTTGPKVKQKDGSEQDHKVLASKDANEIKNVVAWILAQ